jgi:chromosome segregation ATPase
MAKRKGNGLDNEITISILTAIKDQLTTLTDRVDRGFEGNRLEIHELRGETQHLRGDVQSLKDETHQLRGDMQQLRVEVSAALRDVRSDLAEGFGELSSRTDQRIDAIDERLKRVE